MLSPLLDSLKNVSRNCTTKDIAQVLPPVQTIYFLFLWSAICENLSSLNGEIADCGDSVSTILKQPWRQSGTRCCDHQVGQSTGQLLPPRLLPPSHRWHLLLCVVDWVCSRRGCEWRDWRRDTTKALFGCCRIHLDPHGLKWIEVKFSSNFTPTHANTRGLIWNRLHPNKTWALLVWSVVATWILAEALAGRLVVGSKKTQHKRSRPTVLRTRSHRLGVAPNAVVARAPPPALPAGRRRRHGPLPWRGQREAAEPRSRDVPPRRRARGGVALRLHGRVPSRNAVWRVLYVVSFPFFFSI